ncbi:MAG TPA: hypothetical protein VLX64_00760 [Thermoplasmata archaeon]|nr:hypothetical protein [Thermoplasmata archaeon]
MSTSALPVDVGLLYIACGLPLAIIGGLVGSPLAVTVGVILVVIGLVFLLVGLTLVRRRRRSAPPPVVLPP